jgi:hypothetical protein
MRDLNTDDCAAKPDQVYMPPRLHTPNSAGAAATDTATERAHGEYALGTLMPHYGLYFARGNRRPP